MHLARAAKEQSPHRTHKVGALLVLSDNTKISSYNYWPDALLNTIGRDTKLGNASTSLHAETAALIKSNTSTDNAEIYVTDLPCPNCAKIIAEAGIRNVYIDHNTHNTALGQKMNPFFNQVSLLIFKRAGVGVYEIDIEGENIVRHCEESQRPALSCDSNPTLFATCITSDNKPLRAHAQSASGITPEDLKNINNIQNKYEPTLQPFNRLLAMCARKGLRLQEGSLTFSQTPTAREFVNMIGYRITKITIETPELCRDEYGLKALKQLQEHSVIEVCSHNHR